MNYSVVIPARFASTRLPGKPLADIAGRPMIQHVWERARQSRAARVVIATDDRRVFEVAAGFGAEVCMTDPGHASGTDRLQEVARQLGFDDEHVLVNVQGDEPLLPPAVIDQVAANLQASAPARMATLVEPLRDPVQLRDPNVVKVVFDERHLALYFSRAPIPWDRDAFAGDTWPAQLGGLWWRHIGLYAYRVSLLHDFVRWPAGRLEQLEKLEQLRALEQGVRIHVAEAAQPIPGGVDTPADLERVRALLAS